MFTTSSVQFSAPSSQFSVPGSQTVDLRSLLEVLQAKSPDLRATLESLITKPKPPVSPFEVLSSEVRHHLKRSKAEREALFVLHLQGYEVENAMIEALDYEADVLRRTIELLERLHERTS